MGIFWIWRCLKYFVQIPVNSARVEGLMSASERPLWCLSGFGSWSTSQSSLRHPRLVLAVFLGLLSGRKGSWMLRIQVSLTADQPPGPTTFSWGWYCPVFLPKQRLELRQKKVRSWFYQRSLFLLFHVRSDNNPADMLYFFFILPLINK